MKNKIKTVSKYIMNILAMINALIVGLSPIWNWNLTKITDSIVVITGIIGLYLVGGKLFSEEVDTHEIIEEDDEDYE